MGSIGADSVFRVETIPELGQAIKIGENDHYWFGVAQCEGDWVGFAEGAGLGLFILPMPQMSESWRRLDLETVIRFTGAFVQCPEQGYGGIDRWFVPEDLRVDPKAYRCADCGSITCRGECVVYDELFID